VFLQVLINEWFMVSLFYSLKIEIDDERFKIWRLYVVWDRKKIIVIPLVRHYWWQVLVAVSDDNFFSLLWALLL
jgi:hypothetical protein